MNHRVVIGTAHARRLLREGTLQERHMGDFSVYDSEATSVTQPQPADEWLRAKGPRESWPRIETKG